MTSEEVGKDYEHVEALQKNFDEFQKVSFKSILHPIWKEYLHKAT